MPGFGRYVLGQLPGWAIVGIIFVSGARTLGVATWVTWLALALFIVKDLALYPVIRAVFQPASDRRLVGETGEAVEALAPTGSVRVQGERWRARMRGDRHVSVGAPVRVVGAHGLTLVVEPVSVAPRAARAG